MIDEAAFDKFFPELGYLKTTKRYSDQLISDVSQKLKRSDAYKEHLLAVAKKQRVIVSDYLRQEIDFNEPLTDSQVKMLHKLAERPVTPDEDCPELTAAQLSEFKKVSENRRAERCKQTVTLRLSPQALKKAKSLGKGYTSILSRILENALDNPDIIQHNL